MGIILNGQPRELVAPTTVAELLERLEIGRERVAVMINGRIIRKESFEAESIQDGDAVEVVHMVGGG